MESNVVLCGSGGQGILLAGTLLAYSALAENKKATWLPSYGAEKRGGLSFCVIVISKEEIASPIPGYPSVIIGLDNIGMNAYEDTLAKGGLIILNTSLVKRELKRKDAKVVEFPFNEIAKSLGNPRVLNMAAVGTYAGITKVLKLESLVKSLEKVISKRHLDMLEINKKALQKGYELGLRKGIKNERI